MLDKQTTQETAGQLSKALDNYIRLAEAARAARECGLNSPGAISDLETCAQREMEKARSAIDAIDRKSVV